MDKIDWKRKLTSRKFWAAICNFVGMMILAFGGNAGTVEKVTALIMAGATVIAYIIAEGLVDASNKIPEGMEEYIYEEPPEEEEEEENG